MSNALAVATVTAAITTMVQMAVDTAGITPGPVVTPGTLEDSGDHARVSVHLYRVSRDPAMSNVGPPVRNAAGELRARPQVALELHYLLCFRADTELAAQTMLAVTAATLETNPGISDQLLTLAEADHPAVLGNDLREAAEPVRVSAEGLSIDELTRLWALYAAGSFALTLAIAAAPVLVESSATPGTGLPVLHIALGASTFDAPRLDSVAGPEGPGAPLRAGSPMPELHLRGAGLGPRRDETVEVLVDGTPLTPVAVVDDGHLTVRATGLKPGVRRVLVRRVGAPIDPALSPTPVVLNSEARALMVAPTLVGLTPTSSGPAPSRSGTIEATLLPPVGTGQRVRLLLDGGGAPPRNVVLPSNPLPSTPSGTVVFAFADLPGGSYRVTVEVDGARSIPPVDVDGHYVLPEVDL